MRKINRLRNYRVEFVDISRRVILTILYVQEDGRIELVKNMRAVGKTQTVHEN